jgi:8-oxo-dGTP diphosphatase
METAHFVLAVGAVIVHEHRMLAMRRSEKKSVCPGLWEVCSGRVEEHEQPEKAIAREIEEETGLTVRIDDRPIDAYVARYGQSPMAMIIYRAEWKAGEVRRSDEHDMHAWWTLAEVEDSQMPKRLIEAVRLAMQRDA